jgi:hypothetical protein
MWRKCTPTSPEIGQVVQVKESEAIAQHSGGVRGRDIQGHGGSGRPGDQGGKIVEPKKENIERYQEYFSR